MTSSFSGTFEQPSAGGDKVKWEHLNGCVLLIFPKSVKDAVKTKDYGEKEAVVADIVALTNRQGEALPLDNVIEYKDAFIFPGFLVGATRNMLGRMVLGKLYQGKPEKGNPPWKLAEFTDDMAALATAYMTGRSDSARATANEAAADASADPFAPV